MTGGPRRVYVPVTAAGLRDALARGSLGPAPLRGHTVTPALVAALGGPSGASEEEQEYAAMAAAGLDAVGLLGPDDPPVRLVAAVDAGRCEDAGDPEDLAAVVVPDEVPLRRLASVHADDPGDPEATAAVAAARDALAAEDSVPAEADRLLDRCLDHELGWWAAQELPALLELLRR